MYGALQADLQERLSNIRSEGLYKDERVITTPQGSLIAVKSGKEVVNFCANNYLGLANNPEIREAARKALDTWGYEIGRASCRERV